MPPERLLVYEVKEGWEPLCRFLGVPVPQTPFPHVNDAETFLFMLESSNTSFNYGAWTNAEYDRLMAESRNERDIAKRGELLKQAEQILLDDYGILPTRYPNETWLVREYVKGFTPNLRNQFRTRWMSIEGDRFALE